jgi:glycosyltransferase involved in cell wall biosynthesis
MSAESIDVTASITCPEEVPAISLVICTRNRDHRLHEVLSFLPRLVCSGAWEVVIVNNASTDDTSGVLTRYEWPRHMRVRVMEESRVGLAAARNAGWRAARGRIVAFTDDDCYPREDFLDSVLTSFTRSPVAYIGGRILLFDPADFPITIQTQLSPVAISPHAFIPAGLIQGANMAVLRAALLDCGGFDEFLGAGTPFPSEDLDILMRLSALGYAGRYDPEPVVLHHHGRRGGDEIRRLRTAYDKGRGACYVKGLLHPEFRLPVCREVYRSFRNDLQRTLHTRRLHRQSLNELNGAIHYASARAVAWIRHRLLSR